MAGQNKIPERLANFNVYLEGNIHTGVADLELPNLERMSESVTGAGISGEVETPTMGQYGAMGVTINYRTITKDAIKLDAPKAHAIEARGAQQIYDAASGTVSIEPVRVAMTIRTKNSTLGSFEVGATTGSSVEAEVTRIAIWINGKKVRELDKFNGVDEVDGVDYGADIRRAIGLN